MRGNETLNKVAALLRDLGGYYVFVADNGEEYIVAAKKDFGALTGTLPAQPELQLPLPPAANQSIVAANELMDRINRDIALYRSTQEQFDDLNIEDDSQAISLTSAPLPPPRRVRFEPLRGDLPPELQE